MKIDLELLNKYHQDGLLIKQKHPKFPLTIWNYSQNVQYTNNWDGVTIMCRGLVTNDNTGEIIARPFKKFFNIEENKYIPTKDFSVYEKVDGSMISYFHFYGEWIAASRGSFTSDHAIAAQKILDKLKNESGVSLNIDSTYIFELTAPWARIVIDYGDNENLTLLAIIRNEDGFEPPKFILEYTSNKLGCDLVKEYNGITDYKELKEMVEKNHEGFVVKFSNGERVKIKGTEYLYLHKIMTNISTTSIWEMLSNNEPIEPILEKVPDEFYSKIKEYENELINKYQNIENEYKNILKSICGSIDIINRAEFAKKAKECDYPGILFNMLDNKDYSNVIWKIIKPSFRKL